MKKRSSFSENIGLKSEGIQIFLLLLVSLIYALGINLFIVPAGLYTGGILGLSQLFRSFLIDFFHLDFGNIDISGIIYYGINAPFLIIAHNLMGKLYFAKSILCITAESVFLAVIPIPQEALVSDTLAASIIGGIIAGSMMGTILRLRACDGGMDLIGVLIVHQKKGASVGNANLYVNILVFGIMAVSYPVSTLIYSLITAIATAYSLDYFFSQNINVEVHIILQAPSKLLEKRIHNELRRSVTSWEGIGTYSGKTAYILYVIVDKYETAQLRKIIAECDPNAFIVENTKVTVGGNFEKHLN